MIHLMVVVLLLSVAAIELRVLRVKEIARPVQQMLTIL